MESPDSPVTKAELEAALQAALGPAVDEIKSYVREQVFDAETKLLRAFADYNSAATIRFRKLEADVSNIDAAGTQRLALVETKLTDLEIRMIKLEAKS
jgi:hypothetical protein